MSVYTSEVKNNAIRLYTQGLSGKEVEAITGVPHKTIHYWCRSQNVTRHRGPQSKIGNETYFSEITTEEQAYYLGWIMADGNVSTHNNQYSLKMHIASKDKVIIYSFVHALGSKNKVQERDTSIYVSLTSKELVTDLMTLGVLPAKSGKEVLPVIYPNLNKHFIRGFFDGDGITCIKKSKRSGFCGGVEVLKSIQELTNLHKTIFKNKGTNYFLVGIKESRVLYDYMYEDATIWLPRKRERMDIICGNTEVTTRINKMVEP